MVGEAGRVAVAATNEEVATGNLLQDEAHILGGHCAVLQDVGLAQHTTGGGADDGRRLRRVDHGGDNGHRLHRRPAAKGAGRVRRHLQNAPVDHAVRGCVVAAHRTLQHRPFGDDVERRPGLECADGDNDALVGIGVATDNTLQGDDDLGRSQNRVSAQVGGRAVAAPPLDGNGEDAR